MRRHRGQQRPQVPDPPRIDEFVRIQEQHPIRRMLAHGKFVQRRIELLLGKEHGGVLQHGQLQAFGPQRAQNLNRPIHAPIIEDHMMVHQNRMVAHHRLDDIFLVQDT